MQEVIKEMLELQTCMLTDKGHSGRCVCVRACALVLNPSCSLKFRRQKKQPNVPSVAEMINGDCSTKLEFFLFNFSLFQKLIIFARLRGCVRVKEACVL